MSKKRNMLITFDENEYSIKTLDGGASILELAEVASYLLALACHACQNKEREVLLGFFSKKVTKNMKELMEK